MVFQAISAVTFAIRGHFLVPKSALSNERDVYKRQVWAVLIPGAFNVWNMILARTYYQSIPAELREASAIDGANAVSYTHLDVYKRQAFCNPEQIYRQSVMSSTFIKYFKFKEVNKRGKEAQIIYSPVYACLLYTSLPGSRELLQRKCVRRLDRKLSACRNAFH